MALALGLTEAGHPPAHIDTTARVAIEKGSSGFHIPRIELQVAADVPGIDAAAFACLAQDAKETCPVSRALAGTDITLDATLVR
jgi:osmotically inducible protein OsmC